MGLLPFDDWIYHLPYLRDQVNTKHADVLHTQNDVQSEVLLFNKQLEKFRILLSNQALLIYIDKTVRMTDLQLKDFTAEIEALPPPVKGDLALNLISGSAELIDGIFVLKFIVNVGKMVKNSIFAGTEGSEAITTNVLEDIAADALDAGLANAGKTASTKALEAGGEEVTEAVVKSAGSSVLVSTGVGIFLAVGIDVIFAAINGAKEKDKLKSIISELDDKMKVVKGYLKEVHTHSSELDVKAISTMTTFKNLAYLMKDVLPDGHKSTVDTNFPATMESLGKCLAEQQHAIAQFGMLVQLRTTYEKALVRNPNVTKTVIISSVLITSSRWVTYDFLERTWDEVLAKYSDLMKNAK